MPQAKEREGKLSGEQHDQEIRGVAQLSYTAVSRKIQMKYLLINLLIKLTKSKIITSNQSRMNSLTKLSSNMSYLEAIL